MLKDFAAMHAHRHVQTTVASSGYGNGVPRVQHSCIPSSLCAVRSATGQGRPSAALFLLDSSSDTIVPVLLTAAVHSRRDPDSQKASHVDYLSGAPA